MIIEYLLFSHIFFISGCCGTIVENAKTTGGPPGTVMVHWDNGKQSNYRVGHLNAYDLRMLDNGPCGVKHTFHVCNYCKDSDSGNSDRKECVAGIMWACASCPGMRLCTRHYMNDKHDTNHQFLRYESPSDVNDQHATNALAALVPPRRGSKKVILKVNTVV